MHSVLRILRSTGALWPLYAGIIACSVLTALATLVGPFLIRDATDAIVGALSDGTPSDDEISRVTRTVAALAGGLLAASLLQTVVRNIGGYWGDIMAARMREILSTRYFAKLLSLPQRYFDNQVTGTIIARLDRSITNVTQFMQSASNNFSPMLVTVAAVLGITVLHWWPLAVLLALVFPTYLWLTALTSRRWLVFEKDKNDEVDHAGGRFAEVVGQVKAVRSYVAEVREVAVFGRRYDRTVALTRRQSRWWHLMDSLRGSLLNLIFFGIYLLLFLRTLNSGFSIGTMVMLIQLVAMVRAPAEMMSYMIDTAQRAVAGSRDYFAVMEMDSEPAAPRELARAASASSGFGDLDRGRTPAGPLPVPEDGPAVEFDDVSFAYEGDDEVIHGVTFSAQPGERVALVGESGGGKSTLVNLLLGFYAPTGGTLRVCGADAAHTPMERLRASSAVVFQDASLFSGTIRENIAYGRPGATDEEIEDAARRANADGFIRRFADGYDTVIGERGVRLSGGQRQRVAIARAILKDAPVLILDEATSALDTKAEREVQRGLEELMAGRTTIIIAHRLSTISGVDTIVTLRDGHVDEVGPPAVLATSGGIYSELLRLTASASAEDRKRLKEFGVSI